MTNLNSIYYEGLTDEQIERIRLLPPWLKKAKREEMLKELQCSSFVASGFAASVGDDDDYSTARFVGESHTVACEKSPYNNILPLEELCRRFDEQQEEARDRLNESIRKAERYLYSRDFS